MIHCDKSGENRRELVEKFKIIHTSRRSPFGQEKAQQSLDSFNQKIAKFLKISWNLWVFWTNLQRPLTFSSCFSKYYLDYSLFSEPIYTSKEVRFSTTIIPISSGVSASVSLRCYGNTIEAIGCAGPPHRSHKIIPLT